jgi:hypothetical protein
MYFKYTPYLYLVAAAFFLYDAVMRYRDAEPFWLSLIFVAVAVFMFFFRKHSYKKFTNRHNNK